MKNQETKILTKLKLSAYMSKLQNKISDTKPTSTIAQKGQRGSKELQKLKNKKSENRKKVTK